MVVGVQKKIVPTGTKSVANVPKYRGNTHSTWSRQMPVKVRKLNGKYRLVEPSGRIAKTHLGNPIDGGGSKAKLPRMRQANKVNEALRKKKS